MKVRKGIAVEAATLLIPLIMFLGTGVYKMFVVQKDIPKAQSEHKAIKNLQNKYCGGINPSAEDLKMCIDALKLSIPEE